MTKRQATPEQKEQAAARRTTRGPRRFALRTRYTTLIKNSKGVTSTS